MADDDQSFRERVEEIRQERAEQRGENTDTSAAEVVPPEPVRKLAERAKSETVTGQRLMGDEKYFYQVISYLEEGEQPHFLFPLTMGLTADDALVVEAGAEQTVLLSNMDGGSCVITDRYTRIVSGKGEWTIPHNSVVSVDFVGHPALHVQTSGRTYYIKIAGTFFDEEENLSEAATYIREKQRESASGESDEDGEPLEKLAKLGELRDRGVITEEEFQEKKQDLLDEI